MRRRCCDVDTDHVIKGAWDSCWGRIAHDNAEHTSYPVRERVDDCMRRTTLRTELMQALNSRFGDVGFHRLSDAFYGDRFVRPRDRVSHQVAVNSVLRYDSSATVFVAVRFDAIERAIAEHEQPNSLLGDDDIAGRITLGFRLKSLTGGDRRWNLKSTGDVTKTADALFQAFLKQGEPWLKTYEKPQRALEFLSGDFSAVRENAGPDDISTKKAVALALELHGAQGARAVASTKLANLKPEAAAEVAAWLNRFLPKAEHHDVMGDV